ncbi:hypothetical protein BAE44_0012192 [Dichanthelium oligosanthes]|uniref:Phytocyanin domain-containing protein n=1 Tax=Dichanthelium oligosanthes TaxID=888268 RepID=A0A1E5VNU6_9POAL|nr:hypothetical protein BAE44_0012192 [Dichanthelium oligosanthes]
MITASTPPTQSAQAWPVHFVEAAVALPFFCWQLDLYKFGLGPCSSNASLVLALGFAAFVAASAATSHSNVFDVGNKDVWVGKPAESYDRWAARHRLKVTDTLVFKYKKGADSVLIVDERHYDACDRRRRPVQARPEVDGGRDG